MIFRCVSAVSIAALLSACGARSNLPIGGDAFPVSAAVATASRPASLEEYQIGPRDILMVSVFNEPGLSFEQLPVSSGGTIAIPLIGTLPASGRTAEQLANEISARLNTRYLRNARAAVSVVTATNYTITVDGAVNKPGIYDIPGHLMLSQALAIAGGGGPYARLNEIVVFRDVNGQRYAARFNINDIRAGQAPDFELKQRDTVVVGYNYAAALFRDIVTTLPSAAAVFVALR